MSAIRIPFQPARPNSYGNNAASILGKLEIHYLPAMKNVLRWESLVFIQFTTDPAMIEKFQKDQMCHLKAYTRTTPILYTTSST